MNSIYIWDEHRDWIPEALAISFDPDNSNLPIRTEMHGALVAYLVKLGAIFGEGSHLAFRWTSVFAGVCTVAVVAGLARRFAGYAAGILAASLLAFNEYHITISILAIQLSWYTLFSALAILLTLDFLDEERDWQLITAGAAAALSFLAYEVAALTIIALVAYALCVKGFGIVRRRAFFVSAAVALLIALPDFYVNFLGGVDKTTSYDSFLGRIVGFGINPQYSALLVSELIDWAYPTLLGRDFIDIASDYLLYKGMNSLFGLLLLGSAGVFILSLTGLTVIRTPRHAIFYLAFFWGVLGFFTMMDTTDDYALWLWAGIIVIPGTVLAAGLIAIADKRMRFLALGLAGAGAVFSISSLAINNYDLPKIKGHALPSPLSGLTSTHVETRFFFDVCDLCGSELEFRLQDVFFLAGDSVVRRGSVGLQSLISSPSVQNASRGEDDRTLSLEIIPAKESDWIAGTYLVEYDVIDGDRSKGAAFAHVVVENGDSEPWPNAFWLPGN